MMEFHAEIEMQEQKPSLLGLCLARREKAKPIDHTQFFQGFVLWKEEKVVPLRKIKNHFYTWQRKPARKILMK